jgi:hypothetical protein
MGFGGKFFPLCSWRGVIYEQGQIYLLSFCAMLMRITRKYNKLTAKSKYYLVTVKVWSAD